MIAGLRCSSDKGCGPRPPESGMIPESVTLDVSSSQQFEVVFDGETPEVLWYVEGVLGGSPETGMITPGGLYIAPAKRTAAKSITVTAKAVLDTLLHASANVVVHEHDGIPSVEITPGAVTVAAFDSVEFSYSVSGCSFEDPIWSAVVISGETSDTGTLRPGGTYVAPESPIGDFELMLMAKSATCRDKTGIARVRVKMPVRFYVELEDFTDSWGDGIRKGVACGGGVGVVGLEAEGEWIQIPVTVPAGGRYTGHIRYAAGGGDVLELTVAVEGCGPDGTSPTATFVLDEGTGVGG